MECLINKLKLIFMYLKSGFESYSAVSISDKILTVKIHKFIIGAYLIRIASLLGLLLVFFFPNVLKHRRF